jgi:hypothetical protein
MRLDAPRLRLIALLLGLAAIVVVAILLIGGGEESPEESARASAEDFVGSLTAGDYDAACGMLSDTLRDQIGGEGCADELSATVGQAGSGLEIEVVNVRVSGPKAVAETRVRSAQAPATESSFEMQLEEETWRVSSLGS